MSRPYKEINNGNGKNLAISEGRYLSMGKGGGDVTIRGNGRIIAFDNWDDFVDAINITKSVWARDDNANATYEHGNRYSMEEQK